MYGPYISFDIYIDGPILHYEIIDLFVCGVNVSPTNLSKLPQGYVYCTNFTTRGGDEIYEMRG